MCAPIRFIVCPPPPPLHRSVLASAPQQWLMQDTFADEFPNKIKKSSLEDLKRK